MLLFLTGDFSEGVLHKHASFSLKKDCYGELQLLNSDCHKIVLESSILLDDKEACGFGSEFIAEHFPDYNTFLTSRTRERIVSLYNITNTYIIMNAGAHFSANQKSFLNYYLKYFTDVLTGHHWPKLIVEGLPKTPSVLLSDQRGLFADAVKDFCSKSGLVFFDNFSLTTNLMAYDGKHFGLPYYLLKVRVLLNYLLKKSQNC